jgi:hypothetical protein
MSTPSADSGKGEFDGVICFGGQDWWYHNHGHYDLQMMRELSRDVPVLFVNSIGVRVPRPGKGKMFLKRIRRKLQSLSRGLVRVRPNFSVYSPFSIPGGLGKVVRRHLLPRQVAAAAARCGITRPLVWVEVPPAAEAVWALLARGTPPQRAPLQTARVVPHRPAPARG